MRRRVATFFFFFFFFFLIVSTEARELSGTVVASDERASPTAKLYILYLRPNGPREL